MQADARRVLSFPLFLVFLVHININQTMLIFQQTLMQQSCSLLLFADFILSRQELKAIDIEGFEDLLLHYSIRNESDTLLFHQEPTLN